PHREIDFRRNHYLIAPGKVTKGATQYFFAGAISIHVGGIEKVDSQFERSLNENAAIFFLQKPFSFRQAIAHTAQFPRNAARNSTLYLVKRQNELNEESLLMKNSIIFVSAFSVVSIMMVSCASGPQMTTTTPHQTTVTTKSSARTMPSTLRPGGIGYWDNNIGSGDWGASPGYGWGSTPR